MKLTQVEKECIKSRDLEAFLSVRKEVYSKLIEADTLSLELTEKIQSLRAKGFKVILLGNSCKVTF